jgi:peptide-methionine (S)-S-oxide reductase
MRVNPTYEEVSAGTTGHTEALKIVYDPSKISYEKLLQVFWRNHDPLTANAQFCDRGSQYRAGIYYGNEQERHWRSRPRQRLHNLAGSSSRS